MILRVLCRVVQSAFNSKTGDKKEKVNQILKVPSRVDNTLNAKLGDKKERER